MKRKSEAGQALVITALTLPVLILAAGLAIDMGVLRVQKRRLQTAADSAAIAAASGIPGCNGAPQCSGLVAAAKSASSVNGFTDGATLPDGTVGTTVTSSNGPADGPHAGDPAYAEVIVAQKQPTFFMRIAGINSTMVSARAVAHSGNGPGCIYALSGGIETDPSGPSVTLADCAIFDGGPLQVTAPSHSVRATSVGGVSACVGFCYDISPTSEIIASPGDPLAYLPAPTASGSQPCPPSGPLVFTTGNVPSGTYSCQVVINPSGTVTLDGTYVLQNGLVVNNGGIVQSGPDGVTLYNTGGGAIAINEGTGDYSQCGTPFQNIGSIVQLSAPTSAANPYAGILLMQDRSDTQAASITMNNGDACPPGGFGTASNTSYMWGAMYLPTAALNLIGTGLASSNRCAQLPRFTLAVANSMFLSGDVNIGTDSCNGSSYPTPQPSPIKAASLVE